MHMPRGFMPKFVSTSAVRRIQIVSRRAVRVNSRSEVACCATHIIGSWFLRGCLNFDGRDGEIPLAVRDRDRLSPTRPSSVFGGERAANVEFGFAGRQRNRYRPSLSVLAMTIAAPVFRSHRSKTPTSTPASGLPFAASITLPSTCTPRISSIVTSVRWPGVSTVSAAAR